jgi:hypothetical protein
MVPDDDVMAASRKLSRVRTLLEKKLTIDHAVLLLQRFHRSRSKDRTGRHSNCSPINLRGGDNFAMAMRHLLSLSHLESERRFDKWGSNNESAL